QWQGQNSMGCSDPANGADYKQPPTYFRACVLQVCGVHRSAKCYRPRLCFPEILLHLHEAQLQVHALIFFPFALLLYFLQFLLQCGQKALVCRGKKHMQLRADFFFFPLQAISFFGVSLHFSLSPVLKLGSGTETGIPRTFP
uniref:Uncharacterized protein n=1 Tax=Podarcis muralis TaxID=64176 RepID=A0A670HV29_PODMU